MPDSEIDTTVVGGEHETGPRRSKKRPMPQRIGRYSIVEQIGRGGMGIVYGANDPELERKVAIKVVSSPLAREAEEVRNRALREAQALARLEHPNVVRVYDVGIDDGSLYIAMERIEGRTLAEDRHTDRAWRDVLGMYLQAGEALAAAHADGIVHRDFKPHNVMRTEDGAIKVLDFGLARLVDAAPSEQGSDPPTHRSDSDAAVVSALDIALTTTGCCLGTPAYMAPEQFGSTKRVGPAADQFAFCVSLWEGLYGRRPFSGSTLAELRQNMLAGPPAVPPATDVPTAIARILRVGMRAEAAQRHRDMPALLAALRSAGRGSRVLGALVLTAAAFAVGLTVLTAAQPETPCTQAADILQPTWSPARRDATEAAVLGTGRAFATSTWAHLQPRLDAWAQAWIDSHEAICLADRSEEATDPLVFDRRMACLDRTRARMDALVAALGEGGDPAVRRAIETAAALPDPAECVGLLEAGSTKARAPAVTKQLDLLRRRLDAAQAKAQLGEVGAALETALSVRVEAREHGDEGLAIDAMLLEADERGARGERHAAESTLREAYLAAVEADDARRAARAARALVFVTGIDSADYEQALEWARHAQAQLDRLAQPDPLGEAALMGNLGAVLGSMGKHEECTRTQLRALTLERSVLDDDDLRLLGTFGNVTTAMMSEGRFEEARHYAERAVALAERNLGEDHPDNIEALQIHARVLRGAGDPEGAVALMSKAHAITVAAYGESNLHAARTLDALALANLEAGHAEVAVDQLTAALAVYRVQLGEHHPDRASALRELARALHGLGRIDETVEAMRGALAIEEHRGGPDHPRVAHLAGNLATALREAGELEEAIALYQRAVSILDATPEATSPNEGLHDLNLARALQDAERWTDAERVYGNAADKLQADPHHEPASLLDALSARAEVLLELGRFQEALALQRDAQAKMLELSPKPDDVRLRRTFAYIVLRGARLMAASPEPTASTRDAARSSAQQALDSFKSLDDEEGVTAAEAVLNGLSP